MKSGESSCLERNVRNGLNDCRRESYIIAHLRSGKERIKPIVSFRNIFNLQDCWEVTVEGNSVEKEEPLCSQELH